MNQTPNVPDSNSDQVYGFLCPTTNVFYAFDTFEVYQQFLQWLEQQQPEAQQNPSMTHDAAQRPMINESDQLEDYKRATDEIMQVFEDPVFGKMDEEIELQEVDF